MSDPVDPQVLRAAPAVQYTLVLAILALVTGGSSYVGSSAGKDEPGVVVYRLGEVEATLAQVEGKLDALTVQVQNGTVDRWTEQEHQDYAEKVERRLDRIERRLDMGHD